MLEAVASTHRKAQEKSGFAFKSSSGGPQKPCLLLSIFGTVFPSVTDQGELHLHILCGGGRATPRP